MIRCVKNYIVLVSFLMMLFAELTILDAQAVSQSEVMIITLRSGSVGDVGYSYEQQLMELALSKTVSTDGAYEIKKTPPMNFTRALYAAEKKRYPNLFIKTSYRPSLEGALNFIPFPVDLGILGYRVCFISSKLKATFPQIRDIEDLKPFTIGQGTGWPDVNVLEEAGLKVVTSPKYENLFSMVEKNRFDLFCRGVNELQPEWDKYGKNHPDLAIEESFVLFYPFPRFFWTHEDNGDAMDRISRGLILAYEDDSIVELWNRFNLDNVKFAALGSRAVIELDNPDVTTLDERYQHYLYNPKSPKH